MKNLFLGFGLLLISVVLFDSCGEDSNPAKIITIDTTIQTVSVGNQIWMKEYWNGITYTNGDTIPKSNNIDDWMSHCNNNEGTWRWNADTTCKLYNGWVILDSRGVGKDVYRLPDDYDIRELIKFTKIKANTDSICIKYEYEFNSFIDSIYYKLERLNFYNDISTQFYLYREDGYKDMTSAPFRSIFWINKKKDNELFTFIIHADLALIKSQNLKCGFPIRLIKK